MDPINYQIQVKDPFESGLQGYTQGLQLGQLQREIELKRIQQEQALQMQRDLVELSGNKAASAADYAAMITKYPQLSEQLKRGWDVLAPEQQQSKLKIYTPIYAALQNGANDVAEQLLNEQALALRNSGDEARAKEFETMAQLLPHKPELVKSMAGLGLASVMGGDKFADTFSKLGAEQRAIAQAPADLRIKNADATTKEAKAKYAESEALLELEQKGWNIKKIQEDIKTNKENSRIAAMNAAAAREGNSLKRQELQLKIDEAKQKRDEGIRDKVATVEAARTNIDNMLNTADRILKNPSLNDVVGSIEGRLPSVASDEGADAIAMIETLKSQSFLAQIPNIKGMGALSNAEGEKLQAALQNLDRVQSESQFKANLKEAQRLILKARKNLVTRYGVPENVPDTPAAAPNAGEIDALLKKYGGK